MNLKRTLISTIAALGLATSLMTPVALAGDSADPTAGVSEGGTFSYNVWNNNISFGTGPVDTVNGTKLTRKHQVDIVDTRTSSPGWTLTLTATDFTTTIDGTEYSIDTSDNLSVVDAYWHVGVANNCINGTLPAGNPSNPFGTRNTLDAKTLVGDGGVDVFSIKPGRGCGTFYGQMDYELNVPAGTAVGTYTSKFTLTNTGAPGS